jgi:hypothetical protein
VDILRTTANQAPTGACNCAVATGVTTGSTNDQSNSLGSYTISLLAPELFDLTLTVETVGSGATHLMLRKASPSGPLVLGALVCDLSIACGGSGSPVSITATSPIVVTPSPIVNTGVISHAASGVTAGTYVSPSFTVNATGHINGVTPGYLPCESGIGDGTNAITAATYLQSFCHNKSGATRTITRIECLTDNNGTSTMTVADNLGNALLTGAITCTNSWAVGTQSATVAIPDGGWLAFSFVSDGSSKQWSFHVTW